MDDPGPACGCGHGAAEGTDAAAALVGAAGAGTNPIAAAVAAASTSSHGNGGGVFSSSPSTAGRPPISAASPSRQQQQPLLNTVNGGGGSAAGAGAGIQRVPSTSSTGSGGKGGKPNPVTEGFQVSAAWSVAGVGTCIQLRHPAFGLHIALDMGTSAGEALGANHVFVSHSHVDHIGALLNHARARTLSNKPAKYYVPISAVEPLQRAKEAYEALDGHPFQCEILGVQPGDVIRFHPNVKAVVFPTLHRVPSQGYAFVREQSKGLKAEYRSLSSRDLGALRKQGVEVVDTEEIIEAAYTGDTKLEAVLGLELVEKARLLIMECTYLEGEVVWAHKWHHVHIQEIVQHAHTHFAANPEQRLVLCHVSRKYKLHDNVLSLVRQALAPVPALAARVGVTLTGFGRPAQEPVTWLADGGARAVGAGGDGEGGGADGGLESSEMPEVRTKEEVGRMLRVMSEDLGLRPRAESLAGEIEIVAAGGSTCGGGGGGGKGGGRQQEQEEEEPTLQF